MKKLYDGTINKLDYGVTKLSNMCNDFWLNDIKNNIVNTPEKAEEIENECIWVQEIINKGFADNDEMMLVMKYCRFADEFRVRKMYQIN